MSSRPAQEATTTAVAVASSTLTPVAGATTATLPTRTAPSDCAAAAVDSVHIAAHSARASAGANNGKKKSANTGSSIARAVGGTPPIRTAPATATASVSGETTSSEGDDNDNVVHASVATQEVAVTTTSAVPVVAGEERLALPSSTNSSGTNNNNNNNNAVLGHLSREDAMEDSAHQLLPTDDTPPGRGGQGRHGRGRGRGRGHGGVKSRGKAGGSGRGKSRGFRGADSLPVDTMEILKDNEREGGRGMVRRWSSVGGGGGKRRRTGVVSNGATVASGTVQQGFDGGCYLSANVRARVFVVCVLLCVWTARGCYQGLQYNHIEGGTGGCIRRLTDRRCEKQ